jgi:hypothetical protein
MVHYLRSLLKSEADRKSSVLEREYKSRASKLGVPILGAGNLVIIKGNAQPLRRKVEQLIETPGVNLNPVLPVVIRL